MIITKEKQQGSNENNKTRTEKTKEEMSKLTASTEPSWHSSRRSGSRIAMQRSPGKHSLSPGCSDPIHSGWRQCAVASRARSRTEHPCCVFVVVVGEVTARRFFALPTRPVGLRVHGPLVWSWRNIVSDNLSLHILSRLASITLKETTMERRFQCGRGIQLHRK